MINKGSGVGPAVTLRQKKFKFELRTDWKVQMWKLRHLDLSHCWRKRPKSRTKKRCLLVALEDSSGALDSIICDVLRHGDPAGEGTVGVSGFESLSTGVTDRGFSWTFRGMKLLKEKKNYEKPILVQIPE